MSDLRQRKPGDSEDTTPVTESHESDQVNIFPRLYKSVPFH